MFEMTIVILASVTLMSIAYEFTMMIQGKEWGENASSFF